MNISVENGPPEQVRSTNYNRLCVARDKGKSFVANHLRDVVYKSDLDLALRMSLTSFDPRHEDDSPFSLKEANSVAARKVVLAYVELMLDLFPFEVEVEVREQREENLREYLLRLRRYLKNRRFVGFLSSSSRYLGTYSQPFLVSLSFLLRETRNVESFPF